jgi:hypothetical protein
MSCIECNRVQGSFDGPTSYFRWGTANIEVRACEKHLTEVYGALRASLAFTKTMRESFRPSTKHSCTTCAGFGTLIKSLGHTVPCPDCSSVGDLDT